MNRNRYRNDHDGHDSHRALETVPLKLGSSPSETERAVETSQQPARFVSQQCQVGNQRQVKINDRSEQVGVDREEVPRKRRAKVRPQSSLIWIRHQPIEEL